MAVSDPNPEAALTRLEAALVRLTALAKEKAAAARADAAAPASPVAPAIAEGLDRVIAQIRATLAETGG